MEYFGQVLSPTAPTVSMSGLDIFVDVNVRITLLQSLAVACAKSKPPMSYGKNCEGQQQGTEC